MDVAGQRTNEFKDSIRNLYIHCLLSRKCVCVCKEFNNSQHQFGKYANHLVIPVAITDGSYKTSCKNATYSNHIDAVEVCDYESIAIK